MNSVFVDKDGTKFGVEDIYIGLKSIGVENCPNVFIHSDIMFGNIYGKFSRRNYLNELNDMLNSLNINNLIVPTFSYSFCNKEVYDVINTPTSMGALNEYIRKQENRYRTLDPLLSVSVPKTLKSTFEKKNNQSLGKDSALDIISNMDDVFFLFLGANLGECFTYVHYIEKNREVPYRFDMPFDGTIIDYNNNAYNKRQYLNTLCYGVKCSSFSHFETYLEDKRLLKKQRVGDKYVSLISLNDSNKEINRMLDKDINYFLDVPFRDIDLVHKYTRTGEARITHC